jgi:hypothetical protein
VTPNRIETGFPHAAFRNRSHNASIQETPKSYQNVTLFTPFYAIVVIQEDSDASLGIRHLPGRTFTIYRARISYPIVVASFAQLQLQHLQHLQHFRAISALHVRTLAQNCRSAHAAIAATIVRPAWTAFWTIRRLRLSAIDHELFFAH